MIDLFELREFNHSLFLCLDQVGLRVWFFALFALDSIAVAAQGLVPVAMASAGMDKARWMSDRLLRWGGLGGTLSGILLGLLAGYIPAVPFG